MRRDILKSQTIATVGLTGLVLKSCEDATRGNTLRGLRLYVGHPRERYAGHFETGIAVHMAVPGAVPTLEPTGPGDCGPRRCWQSRRSLASRVTASSR
jgi:hypothetical protein